MQQSYYRINRIYLPATMNYGLGSEDPEDLANYNKIRKENLLNWDTPEGMDK